MALHEPLDRTAFLTRLKHQTRVQFPHSEIWAPSPDPVADHIALRVAANEQIRCAIQFGEWERSPHRGADYVGDVTWYLATDKAVLRLQISAVIKEAQWLHTTIRGRRWLLSKVRWTELEDTLLPGRAPSCTLTVKVGDDGDEKLTLDSAHVFVGQRGAPGDEREAVRCFALALLEPDPRPME